jgi:hypothetical protein
MRRAFLCLTAILLLAPASVLAQGLAPQEQGALQVQINAAQISARAGSRNIRAIEDIHRRIHSSINCLVGPNDPDFDKEAPNPCAETGKGVIPEHPNAARKARYREAVTQLKAILAMDDRAAAMEEALKVADFIAAVSEGN